MHKHTPESAYQSLITRHQSYFQVGEPDECWLWTGEIDLNGYGIITMTLNGICYYYRAHRLSYCLSKNLDIDELSSDIIIRHTCDVRLCQNHFHLIPGTIQDNNQDRVDRNRTAIGESHSSSKLIADQIRYIRSIPYYHGLYSDLSRQFNITVGRIRKVYLGLAYTNID